MLGPSRVGTAVILAERLGGSCEGRLAVFESEGLVFLRPRLPGPFRAAFTTRTGGVSRPPYESLDLAFHTGDDPQAVRSNHERLLAALPAPGNRHLELVLARQEHTSRVTGAAEYLVAGGGPCDGFTLQPGLDDNLAALLLFADCVPVLLVSEADMAIAHAGWRGLIDGVLQQAARSMTARPGMAVIGPSIGPCCYRVGTELGERFERRYGLGLFREGYLDLWSAAERALAEVGVETALVTNPRLCTSCNHDLFFSHRRDGGPTGRHGLLAWLAAASGATSPGEKER